MSAEASSRHFLQRSGAASKE